MESSLVSPTDSISAAAPSHQAHAVAPASLNERPLGIRPSDLPFETHTHQASEIVIALVGPLGTDNEKVRSMIAERLRAYGYKSEHIRISGTLMPALAGPNRMPAGSAYERAAGLIDLGNQIRRESENNAVLAIAVAAEIGRRRQHPDGEVGKVAYLVSSLKLPAEVAELRKIYGSGLYLFAIHADRSRRVQHLAGTGEASMTQAQAWELIARDNDEPEDYGQHTRDTFHLADFFLADENNDDKLRFSVNRCLDLIFGHPTITPTFNEFAMFMAFAASLRSADLSRQVGAVLAKDKEILSTGANDCPNAGGGLYWPTFIGDRIDDAPRGRDYKRGCDSNSVEKDRLIDSIIEGFPEEQQGVASQVLKDSKIKDITEYGRVVHAEMEALLACARSNTSCVGGILYCTTFPCHNCAKHIIAAGVKQVIYVEPYPKSKALDFHDDAVTTEKRDGHERLVRFKPFIGVGPRQFFDLFSLSLSVGRPVTRKAGDGRAASWDPSTALPRVQMLPFAHRRFETLAADYLKRITEPQGADNE